MPVDDAQNERWCRLMAAAQDGDRRAYETVLREITPFIRGIVRRHHSTADRAEDVVQDVLLTIHRVLHTYDPDRSLHLWVASIAKRRSIDSLRRRGRVQKNEVFAPISYETYPDLAANGEVEAREEAASVESALADLPPKQREALELVKLKELSLAEAAAASGQTTGALKVNLHRALQKLRQRMDGAPPGGRP